MQATSQVTQINTQVEAKAVETIKNPATLELTAVQLALVGGGSGNALFG